MLLCCKLQPVLCAKRSPGYAAGITHRERISKTAKEVDFILLLKDQMFGKPGKVHSFPMPLEVAVLPLHFCVKDGTVGYRMVREPQKAVKTAWNSTAQPINFHLNTDTQTHRHLFPAFMEPQSNTNQTPFGSLQRPSPQVCSAHHHHNPHCFLSLCFTLKHLQGP